MSGVGLALIFIASAGVAVASQDLPPADSRHGEQLATVMGCMSCHGARLDGHLIQDDPDLAVVWSSNLSRTLPRWTDTEVESVLRTGRRPNGTALWIMPTFAHQRVSKSDMADLLAWLRTAKPVGEERPPIKWGPQFARAVAQGFKDSATDADRFQTRQPIDLGEATSRGRYLASIACAECHGPDLKGARDPQPGDPPDLAVAADYTPDAFAGLLKTGLKRDGEPAAEMAEEAPKRLSALSSSDVSAIRNYLVARARN